MARDNQRSKVYKAERQAFAPNFTKGDPAFRDIDTCHMFIMDTLRRKRVQAAFPRAKYFADRGIVLKDGRGTSHARGGSGMINLPLWARNRPVMLHELAHNVAGPGYKHHWQFCDTYLTLVLHALGREAHDKLKAAFKANKVKYTKPRPTRTLSPEQRAANIERLRLYREGKQAASVAAAIQNELTILALDPDKPIVIERIVITEPEREQVPWYEVGWE